MAVNVNTHLVYDLANSVPTKSYTMAVVFDRLAREKKPVSPNVFSPGIETKQLEDIVDELEDRGLVKSEIAEGQGIKTTQITENGLKVYEKLKRIGTNAEEIKRIIERENP